MSRRRDDFAASSGTVGRRSIFNARAALHALLVVLANGLMSVSSGADATTPEFTQSDASATGSIAGRVQVTQKLVSQRMRFRLYSGFKPQPPPRHDGRNDEFRDIVVYIESDQPLPPRGKPDDPLRITQAGETFVPHVLPVVRGSTVEFPNDDPIFHNVFSLSGASTFDLGRYPRGESRSVTFDNSGIVPVFCHLHSNMSAVILVLDNPYFVVPGPEGAYRIDGIPPGRYTIVAWHERSDRVTHTIEIAPGQVTALDLTVPIADEPPQRR